MMMTSPMMTPMTAATTLMMPTHTGLAHVVSPHERAQENPHAMSQNVTPDMKKMSFPVSTLMTLSPAQLMMNQDPAAGHVMRGVTPRIAWRWGMGERGGPGEGRVMERRKLQDGPQGEVMTEKRILTIEKVSTSDRFSFHQYEIYL